jgi:trimeric autotransporter adhesin
MNKKKAIKIAAATAMAASSFAAIAPFTTEAAVNLDTTVNYAVSVALQAHQAYTTPAKTGTLVDWHIVQQKLNVAKSTYNSAVATVNKLAGSKKAYYLGKLTSASKYMGYAQGYITAIDTAQKLHLEANHLGASATVDAANAAYVNFQADITAAQTKVTSRTADTLTKNLIVKTFFGYPQSLTTIIPAVVAANTSLKAADDAVAKGDLTAAKTNLDAYTAQLKNFDASGANVVKVVKGYQTGVQAKYDAANATPAVTSVSAINGNTVQVTFSKALDSTTVVPGNFSAVDIVGGGTYAFNYAELSADGKTVTLTNNTTDMTATTDYSLVVKGIKVSGGTDALNFAQKFTSIKDTTAPSIASVAAMTGSSTTNTVTVNFDESVDVSGTHAPVFKVNGTIVAATQNADKRSFTVQLPSAVAAGASLQFDVSNLYDFAGNSGTVSKTVTVGSDLQAPQITSVEAVSDSVLKVKFNEAVDASKLTFGTGGNVSVTADGMTDAVSAVGSSATGTPFVAGAQPTEAYIVLNPGTIYTSTVKSRNLNVSFKNLTDVYGNASSDIAKTISITKDEVKPTVLSVTHKKLTSGSNNTSTFLVHTSEAVSVNTGANATALNLVDSDGVLHAETGTASYVDSTGAALAAGTTSSNYILVTLPLNTLVDNSSYKVSIGSGVLADLATNTNYNDAVTVSTTVTDGQAASAAAAPTVTGVSYAAGQLTVHYNKAVNVSATVGTNYKLNNVALPSNTLITLDGTKQIATITLPAGFVTSDIANPVLTTTGVQSTDGGQLSSLSTTVTGGTINETVLPVFTKAVYTATNQVQLSFNETTGIKAGTVGTVYSGNTAVGTVTTSAVNDGGAGDDSTTANGVVVETLTVTPAAGVTTLDTFNQGTLSVKFTSATGAGITVLQDAHSNAITADVTVSVTDKFTATAGTLVPTYTSATNQFNVKLTSGAVEAGSIVSVYVEKAGDAPVTSSNYSQFNALTTQSAANLVPAAGISFTSQVDSLGASMTGFAGDNPGGTPPVVGTHVAYIVVKDAAGNVTVSSAAIQ